MSNAPSSPPRVIRVERESAWRKPSTIDERIEILNPPETVIATVGIIKEEPVAAPVLEVEGPTEPEVIGKGKKEEEEGTGETEKGNKHPPDGTSLLRLNSITKVFAAEVLA